MAAADVELKLWTPCDDTGRSTKTRFSFILVISSYNLSVEFGCCIEKMSSSTVKDVIVIWSTENNNRATSYTEYLKHTIKPYYAL